MREATPPLPQYAFMAWCSVKHRDNFTFTFNAKKEGVRVAQDMVQLQGIVNTVMNLRVSRKTGHFLAR
jgi:hypothetical protein